MWGGVLGERTRGGGTACGGPQCIRAQEGCGGKMGGGARGRCWRWGAVAVGVHPGRAHPGWERPERSRMTCPPRPAELDPHLSLSPSLSLPHSPCGIPAPHGYPKPLLPALISPTFHLPVSPPGALWDGSVSLCLHLAESPHPSQKKGVNLDVGPGKQVPRAVPGSGLAGRPLVHLPHREEKNLF